MNIANLWELCTKHMYDDTFIGGLEDFFKENDVKTILDVSGGAGFPSIELKRRGWDVTYSDGGEDMYELFQQRLEESGLEMPHYFSSWLDLEKNVPGTYDLVMCRGNSLPYIDSWYENNISENTLENLQKAFNQFKLKLNDGGKLYVDISKIEVFQQDSKPIKSMLVSEENLSIGWELTHDHENKVRTWKSLVKIDGKKEELIYKSYLLEHFNLVSLMIKAEFSSLGRVNIKGENHYQPYIVYN